MVLEEEVARGVLYTAARLQGANQLYTFISTPGGINHEQLSTDLLVQKHSMELFLYNHGRRMALAACPRRSHRRVLTRAVARLYNRARRDVSRDRCDRD